MGPFLLLINWTLVKSVFMKSLWDRVCISYGTLPISHKLNFGNTKSLWNRVFLMGPFLLLINWSLVKSVLMKPFLLLINCVFRDPSYFFGQICYGTYFLLLINWSLVKCESKNSLLNRECIYISYGTLPITHKLNFGQIWVHKFLMELWVYFLWDPSYYS